MRVKSCLCHRSSPRSQDWPLVIQFSAQMSLAGTRDLPKFHFCLMGWIAVPSAKSRSLGKITGGGCPERGKERREMVNSVHYGHAVASVMSNTQLSI